MTKDQEISRLTTEVYDLTLSLARERKRFDSLVNTVREFIQAEERISEASDKGQDDTGKRDTPTYGQWLALDCAYTEARARLREAISK